MNKDELIVEYEDDIKILKDRIAAQAAEIERLTTLVAANRENGISGQLYNAELLTEKDTEIERLKAALETAEQIRDDLVASADRVGEILFGCYADADPTGNGNDRYWPACAVFLPILDAERVARLINGMMDSDWVHVDGEVEQ